MRKIKTREKEKDIKALDKSAVIGQRMKTAFLRSKRNTESLMNDRQNTPTGSRCVYASWPKSSAANST